MRSSSLASTQLPPMKDWLLSRVGSFNRWTSSLCAAVGSHAFEPSILTPARGMQEFLPIWNTARAPAMRVQKEYGDTRAAVYPTRRR